MATTHPEPDAFPFPGEILAEEFMAPLGLSAYACAQRMNVRITRVTSILRNRRAITADTALRLGRLFGTSAEFWLNLQASHDLRMARAAAGGDIDAIEPIIPAGPAETPPVLADGADHLALATVSNAQRGVYTSDTGRVVALPTAGVFA